MTDKKLRGEDIMKSSPRNIIGLRLSRNYVLQVKWSL